jgi:hypothetical protein
MRGPPRTPRPGLRRHIELDSHTAKRIDRDYGYANAGLFVFVVLALIAALVALALVV